MFAYLLEFKGFVFSDIGCKPCLKKINLILKNIYTY